jgi:hypothetical protein
MRHPDWKHTVLFGDHCCLCDLGGVCRMHRGEGPAPKMQPGFDGVTWEDLIATRDIGDYVGTHRCDGSALCLHVIPAEKPYLKRVPY